VFISVNLGVNDQFSVTVFIQDVDCIAISIAS